MNQSEILAKTASFVKSKLEGEGSGHDWWHIQRVVSNAKSIAKNEKCNLFIVELGALLHDIADHKFNNFDYEIGAKTARAYLETLGVEENIISAVVHIVENVSFSKGKESKMESIEGKIVQDADRLDAIGAIGIARCFAFGGSKNRPMHEPESIPEKDEYGIQRLGQTGINHFYEKLLLVKDFMNTKTGKKMAQHRHVYLEGFLKEFFAEWSGEK